MNRLHKVTLGSMRFHKVTAVSIVFCLNFSCNLM